MNLGKTGTCNYLKIEGRFLATCVENYIKDGILFFTVALNFFRYGGKCRILSLYPAGYQFFPAAQPARGCLPNGWHSNLQFDDVTILQHIIALNPLAVKHRWTPYSGRFQFMSEILVNLAGKIGHGATLFQNKR